jgi:hypothetical protein
MLAQDRSSRPDPSQSSAMPPPYGAAVSYASYADPGFSGGDPSSAGHSTSMAIPSTQSTEALRKQQEAFARAADLRQTLSNLEKVDDEGRRSSLLDTLCSTEDVLGLPEHPNPPGIASGELRVDLLKHQVCVTTPSPRAGFCKCSVYLRICRSKPCNGQSSMRTRSSQRKKRISQCSSGSTERQVLRCVHSPSRMGLLIYGPAGLLLQWCAFVVIGSSRSATHLAL